MKNIKFLRKLLPLLFLAFLMSGCDSIYMDEHESFTMNGSPAGDKYSYDFENNSSHTVKIECSFSGSSITKEIAPGSWTFKQNLTSSSIKVTYSPSDKVKGSSTTTGVATFTNR